LGAAVHVYAVVSFPTEPTSELSGLPFVAEDEAGWGRGRWTGRTAQITVDWHWRWQQSNPDVATIDLSFGL
jgi:hypothetical protein